MRHTLVKPHSLASRLLTSLRTCAWTGRLRALHDGPVNFVLLSSLMSCAEAETNQAWRGQRARCAGYGSEAGTVPRRL